MEAGIYKELQTVASDLLTEFSQGTHRYIEIVPGDGPDDNPGEPTDAPHPYEGVSRGVSWKYAQKSDVGASDLMTTIPVLPVEVELSGFIERPNGARGKITSIDRKPASGPVVAYVVTFER